MAGKSGKLITVQCATWCKYLNYWPLIRPEIVKSHRDQSNKKSIIDTRWHSLVISLTELLAINQTRNSEKS